MKAIDLYKFRILIFITEAIFMTLELLASRVLSPMLGTTLEVWTSIIGIILLSSASGNYYGGELADKNKKNVISLILFLAAISIFIIPILSKVFLGYDLVGSDWEVKVIVCLFISLLLFFLPGFIIGMLTPVVITKEILSKEVVGKTAGSIYSAMTLGGLFGTFISGFFLIPNIGTMKLIYLLSLIMLILSFVFNTNKKRYLLFYLILFTVFSFIFTNNILDYKNNIKQLGNYQENTKISIDTKYGRAIIFDSTYNEKNVKILNVDGGYESAMYVEKDLKNDLVFDYSKKYLDVLDAYKNPEEILIIGGGAYSFPRYIVTYTDWNIDVVEIDPGITKIAKQYFCLKEVMKKYPNRIKNYNEDGRTFINRNKKKYDIILNDAFSGEVPARTLTTSEAVINIKKSLKKNGIYASNIISSLEGKKSRFIKYEILTLTKHFKYVYVLPVKNVESLKEKYNYIVVATDNEYKFNDAIKNINLNNAKVLTDDYSPIEYLTK